jgi:arylsulfatase A
MRYPYYFLLTCLIFFIAGCGAKSTKTDSIKSRPPNVVIIYADDMGHGDLAIQNPNSKIPTPNLDRLARQGMRFSDGHSSSGICSPSRYALLTGRYHWRRMHGIVQSFGPSAFEENEFTMARMFKAQGYKTACFGKWHLGWNWATVMKSDAEPVIDDRKREIFGPEDIDWSKPVTGGPLSQGFDTYYGDGTINFPPYAWMDGDRVVEAPTALMDMGSRQTEEGSWEFRPGPMVDGWDPRDVLPTIAEKTVDYISKQKADTPFFVYFPLTAPHAPIIPNEEFIGKSEAGGFGDFVYQVDWIAGQVMKALEENGLADNTIVIFTADNGPERYAHARLEKYDHWSSGELRGLKRDIWEGGHRVPFIVKWPGKIEPGSVSDALMHQVDLLATLAKITGHDLSNDVAHDSMNQLPIWLGESTNPIRDHAVQNTNENGFAFRKDDWVLIDAKTGEISKPTQWYEEHTGYVRDAPEGAWLFNIKDDLSQRTNLISQHPERASEMRAQLTAIRENGRSVTR